MARTPRMARSARKVHRASRAARARGQVLLAWRHRSLHQPAEDLRAMRRILHLRRRRPGIPRPADVVLRGQFRLPQPAPQQRGHAPIGNAAAGGQPISASRENRTRCRHRPGRREEVRHQGPSAFQRRRQPGSRGQPQTRAQRQERQKPDVCLRGRLSRPHSRRPRRSHRPTAIAGATAISATAPNSFPSPIISAAPRA